MYRTVAELLRHGADPEAHDAVGMRSLHHASAAGAVRLVALLLAHGAAVNAKVGGTPELLR